MQVTTIGHHGFGYTYPLGLVDAELFLQKGPIDSTGDMSWWNTEPSRVEWG